MGQIAGHQAENNAIAGRNRAKLRNFEEQNRLYDREVMFDNAQYRNDISVVDIQQDQLYTAMVDQWTQEDVKLNKLFAQTDYKIEEGLIEMYENEYAGTQTGATAARNAGKSAKKFGQKKSQLLHSLMMSEEETAIAKDAIHGQTKDKSRNLHEEIAFAPIQGPTPMAPEMEPKKSSASLILGLGTTIAGASEA